MLFKEIVSHAADKKVAALEFSDADAVMNGNGHDKVLLFYCKSIQVEKSKNESTLGARPGKTNMREKAKGIGKGRNTAATAALTDKISSESENTPNKVENQE